MRQMARNSAVMRRSFSKTFGQLDRGFSSALRNARSFGRTMGAIGLAGAAAAVAIAKPGADFEEAITAVGAVSLKTRDQIADLEVKAKELGATTKFTATQSANAMEIMAKAGFSSQDILKGVGPILSAAAASGMEIAEVADHVSNALKGMGLEASEAGRVADVLALASSKTNSSIGSLGESIRNVASTARQFKIPLEDTVAAVALLQDVGLDASVAGSAFNTMLTKMAKPTSEIEAKMKKFGVTFKDASGNMLPLQGVLANISKAAKESGGNMDQVAFLADLVGLRGQKAAANLKDLFDSGRVGELTEQLKGASGSAEKMAALRMNNLKGDLTLLGSATDAVRTALYETESGPLRGIIQAMTKWVGLNQGNIVAGFEKFMAVIRPLASIFGDSFMTTIRAIGEGLKVMFPPDQQAGQDWMGVLKGVAQMMGQLMAVTVLVAAGVGAVAVGMVGAVSAAWGAIKGIGQAIVDGLGGIIFAVTNWWADLKALWNAEGMGLVDKTIAIGKHLITGLVKGIKSLARAPYDALVGIVSGAVGGAKKALGINSPSRVTQSIGENSGLGMAKGVLATLPKVESAFAQMGIPANNTQAQASTAQGAVAERLDNLVEMRARGEVVIRNQTGHQAEVTDTGTIGLRVASTGAP